MDFTAMIPARIMFHPPQSYQLFRSEKFVTISSYNSKVSLPLKQVEIEWGTNLALLYFFLQALKELLYYSHLLIFIYTTSGDL